MSDHIPNDPLTLGEIADLLETMNPNRVLPIGFTNPHSWRGYYAEPAVEPARNVTVAEMRAAIARLLTEDFEGWKGGTYRYDSLDELHLAEEGVGGGGVITALIWQLLTAQEDEG